MKEKFIPGIYNYCDRWCERCTFTSRCKNYDSTGKLTPEQLDIDNKAFWDSLSSNFENARKLLLKAAAEYGYDINVPVSAEEEAKYNEKRTLLKRTANGHPLSKLCKQYQQTVRPFIQKSEDLTDKANELAEHHHLGIKTAKDVVRAMAGIGDCFDIIQWYLFFMDAKLQRALHGKMDEEEGTEESGFQKDSDGSAKIALIAIERSIEAWAKLYDLLPASEDVALSALSLLTQLKQKTREEFPRLMEFKRPGFDSIP